MRPTPPQFPQASVGAAFGNPAIPMQTAMDPLHMQRAGQFGPHFDSIPPPADFPQASVSGCCGPGMGDYMVDGRYAPLTPGGDLVVPSGTAGLGDYFVDGQYTPLTPDGDLIWQKGRLPNRPGNGMGDYFVDGRYAPLTTSGNLIVPSRTGAGLRAGTKVLGGFGATSGQDKALVGIGAILLAAGAYMMFKKK